MLQSALTCSPICRRRILAGDVVTKGSEMAERPRRVASTGPELTEEDLRIDEATGFDVLVRVLQGLMQRRSILIVERVSRPAFTRPLNVMGSR